MSDVSKKREVKDVAVRGQDAPATAGSPGKGRMEQVASTFSEETSFLDREMLNALDLYDELKKNFDEVKISRTPGTLRFISEQSRNLVSIRAHILNVIKEKVGVKKLFHDINAKLEAGAGSEEAAKMKVLLELIRKSRKGFGDDDAIEVVSRNAKDRDVDGLLERRLSERPGGGGSSYDPLSTDPAPAVSEASGNRKKKNKRKKGKEELEKESSASDADGLKVVFDRYLNQYVVNEEYEVMSDYEAPPIEVSMSERDGFLVAVDGDGNEYEVVEFGAADEEG